MCDLCGHPALGGTSVTTNSTADYLKYLNQLQQQQEAMARMKAQLAGLGNYPPKVPTKPARKRPTYKEEKMPEIEVITVGGKEQELMLFKVERVADGLRIQAQSENLAKFFLQYATLGEDGKPQVQKISKWSHLGVLKMEKFPTVENATFQAPGDPPIVAEYIVNLSFLRAEKIGEGVDFVIKGVFSTSQTTSFYNAARAAIKELFTEYLQNTKYEYILTGRSSI
jgi:hypothetical protein